MTKNLLLVAALAAALVVPRASAQAVAPVVAPALAGANGTYVNATNAGNLSYVGAPVYRIEVSTPVDTPVLLVSGSGTLYGIQCGSGTTSGYELTFDSATSAGITIATAGKALHAPLYSLGQASAASNVGYLDENESPIQFKNGLVAITHGIAINCYIKARLYLTATSNPNPGP